MRKMANQANRRKSSDLCRWALIFELVRLILDIDSRGSSLALYPAHSSKSRVVRHTKRFFSQDPSSGNREIISSIGRGTPRSPAPMSNYILFRFH